MTHSKGPWYRLSNGTKHGFFLSRRGPGWLNAKNFIGEIADLQNPEDGSLITAAPDLLEACEAAVLALRHRPIEERDIIFIELAIAKAKGE